MSGPKNSELELKRQISERIAAARRRMTDAVAQALCELESMERETRSYALAHAGLEDASETMERIVQEAARAVQAAGNFDTGSDVAAVERHVSQTESDLRRIVTKARQAMAPTIERVRLSKESDTDRRSVTAFARALNSKDSSCADISAALAALGDLGAQRGKGSESPGEAFASSPESRKASTAPATPETLAELARLLKTARDRIAGAYTLESDRNAYVGIAHAAKRAADEAKRSGREFTEAEAQGLIAQAGIVQARMDAQNASLSRTISRIQALEASLGKSAGERPPAFKDADAAYARLDQLESLARTRDERGYIRACIDDVMREHGYDVVRSVDFAGNAAGEHLMFLGGKGGARPDETGIHAFVTDAGDMMLEVVGVSPSGSETDHDAMSAVTDAVSQQKLMEAQVKFCSVYAEIEEDLARRGVVNKVRRKAPPDLRHCKKVSFASATKGAREGARSLDSSAKKGTPRKASQAKGGNAKRPSGKSAKRSGKKEYVTIPAQPVQRRRPAQTPRAREMR